MMPDAGGASERAAASGDAPDADGRRPAAQPPTYLIVTIVVMVLLDRWLPGVRWVAGAWKAAGVAIVLAGVALHMAAGNHFRRHRTTTEALGRARTLVTDGPYRWGRNPMYLGGVIMLLGFGVFLGSVAPFLVVPAFALAIWRGFIRHEEAMLAERFGQEYAAYRERVRRWI